MLILPNKVRARIIRKTCLIIVRLLAQLQKSSVIAVALVAIAVCICLVEQKISNKSGNLTDLLLFHYFHHITVLTVALVALDVCLSCCKKNQQEV